jgi:hypothetical protein
MAGTTIVVVRLFFSRFDGTLTTALSGKVFLVRAARLRNKGATHSRYEIKGTGVRTVVSLILGLGANLLLAVATITRFLQSGG